MAYHPTTYVVTDLTKRLTRITQTEVVQPTFQVPIERRDEVGNRLPSLTASSHFGQLGSLPFHRFHRRTPIQITMVAAKEVADILKLIAQKVQLRSFFVQVNDPRFRAVDL